MLEQKCIPRWQLWWLTLTKTYALFGNIHFFVTYEWQHVGGWEGRWEAQDDHMTNTGARRLSRCHVILIRMCVLNQEHWLSFPVTKKSISNANVFCWWRTRPSYTAHYRRSCLDYKYFIQQLHSASFKTAEQSAIAVGRMCNWNGRLLGNNNNI